MRGEKKFLVQANLQSKLSTVRMHRVAEAKNFFDQLSDVVLNRRGVELGLTGRHKKGAGDCAFFICCYISVVLLWYGKRK